MIGEDQMNGYKDQEVGEVLDEFEARKKKALKLIGREKEEEAYLNKLSVEERAEKALSDFEGLKKFKDRVLENDIIFLREQNNRIVLAINELTKEIASLKNELKRGKMNG